MYTILIILTTLLPKQLSVDFNTSQIHVNIKAWTHEEALVMKKNYLENV